MMADTTTRDQHHIDHREEAIGYLNAAWARGAASDGTDRAIPIQQATAVTHALLYIGDQLAQTNSALDMIFHRLEQR